MQLDTLLRKMQINAFLYNLERKSFLMMIRVRFYMKTPWHYWNHSLPTLT